MDATAATPRTPRWCQLPNLGLSRGVVPLTGQTAIITGSNSGLGLETARQLLDLGCSVILAVRNIEKGKAAQQNLAAGRDIAEGMIEVWELDLSSYESIVKFVKRAKSLERLDIAVLSAGVYKVFEEFNDSTGYEDSIQVNYLSNMLLASMLLPILKDKKPTSHPARLVVVSSDNAAWTKFLESKSDLVLPEFKKPMAPRWDFRERYGTSKLLGQMFLSELAKQVPSSAVTISFANCGMCRGSDLARQATGIERYAVGALFRILGRECAVGARTFVHAASGVLGEDAHGQFIEDAQIQPMAPICYKPEGQCLANKTYEETLDEFSFARIKEVIVEL